MKIKKWIAGYLCLTTAFLLLAAALNIAVDPYFHYHGPSPYLNYSFGEERNVNNGISRHFPYEAVITGTSMTQNFKTSEAEALFGYEFIKIPFSGGSFKEIHNAVEDCLRYHPQVRMVIRGLDQFFFVTDKDYMRNELGTYPEYLYDDNPFNDAAYVLNKYTAADSLEVLLNTHRKGPGIESFDHYSNWMWRAEMGPDHVLEGRDSFRENVEQPPISEENARMVRENILQNVVAEVVAHPEVQFYYFITPYSADMWGKLYEEGAVRRELDAEKLVIQELIQYENVHLFAFNDRLDITTDLTNYRDLTHYGEHINSYILQCMQDGTGRITAENYEAYLKAEQVYLTYDYNSLLDQRTES